MQSTLVIPEKKNCLHSIAYYYIILSILQQYQTCFLLPAPRCLSHILLHSTKFIPAFKPSHACAVLIHHTVAILCKVRSSNLEKGLWNYFAHYCYNFWTVLWIWKEMGRRAALIPHFYHHGTIGNPSFKTIKAFQSNQKLLNLSKVQDENSETNIMMVSLKNSGVCTEVEKPE